MQNHIINNHHQDDKETFTTNITNVLNEFFQSLVNNINIKKNCTKQIEQYKEVKNQINNDKLNQTNKTVKINQIQTKRTIPNKKIIIKSSNQIEQQDLFNKISSNEHCRLKNNRLYMIGLPKKPISSFFFFYKQQSKKIQQSNHQVEGQIINGAFLAKFISKKWTAMTVEEKLPYELLSQQTRDKYKQKMDEFKLNNQEVYESFRKIKRMKATQSRRRRRVRGDNSQQRSQKKQEKNQNMEMIQQQQQLPIMIPEQMQANHIHEQKQQTDQPRSRFKSEHKPKCPVPSFFYFYNIKKQEISLQHNVKTGAQIAKYASFRWKQMNEEEKRPYEEMAEIRRKQYYDEMRRFQVEYPEEYELMLQSKKKRRGKSQKNVVKNQYENEKEEEDEEDGVNNSQVQQNQHSENSNLNQVNDQNPTKSHRPKAPLSSFFIFYKENYSLLSQNCKQSTSPNLAQYASSVWKQLSLENRQPYIDKSNESRKQYYKLMQEYKEKYPDELRQRKEDLKKKHQHNKQKKSMRNEKQRKQVRQQQQQQIQSNVIEIIDQQVQDNN